MKEDNSWVQLSPEEKRRQLYWKQKHLLDTFLEHRAISKAQYDKSLGDLTEKMGMAGQTEPTDENGGGGHA